MDYSEMPDEALAWLKESYENELKNPNHQGGDYMQLQLDKIKAEMKKRHGHEDGPIENETWCQECGADTDQTDLKPYMIQFTHEPFSQMRYICPLCVTNLADITIELRAL